MNHALSRAPRVAPASERSRFGLWLAGLALMLLLPGSHALAQAASAKEDAAKDGTTKENVLRYVRHDGKKLVLEGEIIEQGTAERRVFISRAGCGSEKTVLRLSYDKNGRLTGANVALQNANGQVVQRARCGDGP